MRQNPTYAITDLAEAKDLVRKNAWATMVSAVDDGAGIRTVTSHYPFLVEEAGDDAFTIVSHVGCPDERLHRLGDGELQVIFQGPWGYISPGWYGLPHAVPTWNFSVVHAWGVPELLSVEENLAVLERLVDWFEEPLPEPYRLFRSDANRDYAERIVHGTVGFRMRVTRWEGKRKLSQDKDAEVRERIIRALRSDGPYRNEPLADEMAAELAEPSRGEYV